MFDADGDGVDDANDNCVADSNEAQGDVDADGFGDVCDNCPDVANSDQTDTDEDGFGDACEDVEADLVDCATEEPGFLIEFFMLISMPEGYTAEVTLEDGSVLVIEEGGRYAVGASDEIGEHTVCAEFIAGLEANPLLDGWTECCDFTIFSRT
jgi:hypothetical protein